MTETRHINKPFISENVKSLTREKDGIVKEVRDEPSIKQAPKHGVKVEMVGPVSFRRNIATGRSAPNTPSPKAIEIPIPVSDDEFADMIEIDPLLDQIRNESRANAKVVAQGGIKDGERKGVGFANAGGYVIALQRGVKKHTAIEYRETLRKQYGWSDDRLANLRVSIIDDTGKEILREGPKDPDHDQSDSTAVRFSLLELD